MKFKNILSLILVVVLLFVSFGFIKNMKGGAPDEDNTIETTETTETTETQVIPDVTPEEYVIKAGDYITELNYEVIEEFQGDYVLSNINFTITDGSNESYVSIVLDEDSFDFVYDNGGYQSLCSYDYGLPVSFYTYDSYDYYRYITIFEDTIVSEEDYEFFNTFFHKACLVKSGIYTINRTSDNYKSFLGLESQVLLSFPFASGPDFDDSYFYVKLYEGSFISYTTSPDTMFVDSFSFVFFEQIADDFEVSFSEVDEYNQIRIYDKLILPSYQYDIFNLIFVKQ